MVVGDLLVVARPLLGAGVDIQVDSPLCEVVAEIRVGQASCLGRTSFVSALSGILVGFVFNISLINLPPDIMFSNGFRSVEVYFRLLYILEYVSYIYKLCVIQDVFLRTRTSVVELHLFGFISFKMYYFPRIL